jgi:hypothetical protein
MKGSVVSQISETWQSRAKECRAAAKRLRSFEARNRMLTAAEDFDRMAFNARADQPAEPDQAGAPENKKSPTGLLCPCGRPKRQRPGTGPGHCRSVRFVCLVQRVRH